MKHLFTVLVIAFAFNMSAQELLNSSLNPKDKYAGYIIDKKGNRTEGFIEFTSPSKIQDNIKFYLNEGDRKPAQKVKSEELAEYGFDMYVWKVIPYSGGGSKLKGNLIVNDGCIQKYEYYGSNPSEISKPRGINETKEEYWNRVYWVKYAYRNTISKEVQGQIDLVAKYKKRMVPFLGANSAVAGKVDAEEKGYGRIRIDQVIAEFNEECKK